MVLYIFDLIILSFYFTLLVNETKSTMLHFIFLSEKTSRGGGEEECGTQFSTYRTRAI